MRVRVPVGSMTGDLLPAESMALTVAFAQVQRGEEPSPNVATVCVLALARLDGWHDWTAPESVPPCAACGFPLWSPPGRGCGTPGSHDWPPQESTDPGDDTDICYPDCARRRPDGSECDDCAPEKTECPSPVGHVTSKTDGVCAWCGVVPESASP